MPHRHVVYVWALVAALIAWQGAEPLAAAGRARAHDQARSADAPRRDSGSAPTPSSSPGASVLPVPAAPASALPPARAPIPTATPIPGQQPRSETQGPPRLVRGDGRPLPSSDPPPTPLPLTSAQAGPPASPVMPEQPVPTATPSLLAGNQVVVLYGLPGHPDLGVLGAYSPDNAAAAAFSMAAQYDAANGSDGAKAMLDLVYAQAQAGPTDNGLYLRYLSNREVRQYLRLADRDDLQIMLDLQIGRGDPLDEVRKIERFLRDPRVHVAIDPEYAVGPDGVPLETAGTISGEQLNAIQDYVSGLVERYGLPPKLVVVHQYLDGTVTDGETIRGAPNVDLVFNMDAFGALDEKARKYSGFARRAYSQRHGFNVFMRHDDRVMSADEISRLSPPPDVIFYQ